MTNDRSVTIDAGRHAAPERRWISLGEGLPRMPEDLLLAHARGKVLFIVGAGVSQNSGLPDFKGLVLDVYKELDSSVYNVLHPPQVDEQSSKDANISDLTPRQKAEVKRFEDGDYDVALGMLERRMESVSKKNSSVRQKVVGRLRDSNPKPAPIHKALMRLSDRGGATAIVTTNFDLLLEDAIKGSIPKIQTYALGEIPLPQYDLSFSGVFHIHGAMDRNPASSSDFILTEHDFGEIYMRRRFVPDFIYDAARLFHLVLIGYSANDPPMRYLLNAVAADEARFKEIRVRYVFVGQKEHNSVELEDWRGRGIIPIPYDSNNDHVELLHILERWASLSAHNTTKRLLDAEVKRIAQMPYHKTGDEDRDLFAHLIRRANNNERERISRMASKHKASMDWLNLIIETCGENDRRGK